MSTRAAGSRRASHSWLTRVVAPVILAAWTVPLHALTFRLCVEETAHPPYFTLLMDRLAALDVPMEYSIKTVEMNFMKLLAGRAEVAIDMEAKGNVLMRQARFQRGIEMLQPAFAEVPVYLGLSRQFYESNTRVAERLWHEIARLRKAAPDPPRQPHTPAPLHASPSPTEK